MKTRHTIQKYVIKATAIAVLLLFLGMLFYMIANSAKAITEVGIQLLNPNNAWRPVSQNPQFGLLPIIAGTLFVSFLAVVFAMVFGVCAALFLQYYVNPTLRSFFLAVIDSIAGIPSVIFGFVGLSVIVPFFVRTFSMAAGQSVLAASIVLAVMLLPFVVSVASESITQARLEYETSALALGFSKATILSQVILPAITRGLIAAAMMAFGRGLGETMAVMMVIGNSPIFPKLLGRSQTIPALTALEMGSIEYGSLHLSVLYFANAILLVILFVVIAIGTALRKKGVRHA